jgi:hypothetical protein
MKILENYITELYNRPNRPQNLELETEEEADADEKDPYILQCEVEKAIKDIKYKKARGDDNVPGDVLKILQEDGLTLMTQLNNIYENGE